MRKSPPGVSPFRHRQAPDLSTARAQRDAHLESTIPRQFIWAIDVLAMWSAFGLNLLVAATVQGLVAPGGVLHVDWLRWLTLPGGNLDSLPSLRGSFAVLAVTIPVTVATIELLGGYRHIEQLSRTRLLAPAVIGPILGLSAFTLIVFGLRINHEWSRVFLFGYISLSIVLLGAHRMALRVYKRRRLAAGRYARATAFIGRVDDIQRVLTHMRQTDLGTLYRPVGFFRVDGGRTTNDLQLPDLGSVDRVNSVLVHTPIDLMVIVLPEHGASWLEDVVRACDYLRVTVQVVPAALLDITPTLRDIHPIRNSGPLPIAGVVLQPWDTDLVALFLKRLFDVVVASILLVGLAPLFILIALAIKITTPRERVFYRWQVIGYKGRPFTGYKFTTMVADADARRADLQHLNEMTGPVFKIKNDPRVTPLGRVLRKFSLNELPQLWSVVTGDMSLVGPRPAGSWEIGKYEDWHKRKLSFRPGMTCLWQVRGRNQIASFDDWVRMDLEYIDNWSLWLDFRILVRTAWAVVAGTGS